MSQPVPRRPGDFAGQFLLGRDPVDLPGGVPVGLESLHLSVVPPLGVVRLRTDAGVQIGVLLGRPVDLSEGRFAGDALVVSDAPDPGTADAWMEREIYARLGGSFLAILDHGGLRRVYLDACGSRSAVIEAATGRLAATTPALLDNGALAARFRAGLYTHLDVNGEGWFAGDLTAHEGVTRLLPNHRLDMDGMTVTRHWPAGPLPVPDDPGAACDTIIATARATLAAALAAGEGSIGLTAGTETRFLTALARPHLDRVQFVTVRAAAAARDVWAAGELARRFGLPHRYLPLVHGDAADADDWLARAGYCVGGAHRHTRQSIAPLRARPFFIGGQAGEVGRGFFWRPGDHAGMTLNAAGLEARLGMPGHGQVRAAMERWLSSLGPAGADALLTLDLAYIELRMASWAFGPAYCDPVPEDIFPMISRPAFAAMMSLPADWRADKERMIRETISRAWPELLELPFNRYGDWRDQRHQLLRILRNPGLIAKKLRKLLG